MHHQHARPTPSPATATTYLRAAQAAAILQVHPKTIARWSKQGLLRSQRTLGGHRRYPEPAIRQLLARLTQGVRGS